MTSSSKFTKKVLETADNLAPLLSVAAAERLDEQVSRAGTAARP